MTQSCISAKSAFAGLLSYTSMPRTSTRRIVRRAVISVAGVVLLVV